MKIEISTSGRSISPKIASFGNLFAFSSHLFLHKYIGDICSKSDVGVPPAAVTCQLGRLDLAIEPQAST